MSTIHAAQIEWDTPQYDCSSAATNPPTSKQDSCIAPDSFASQQHDTLSAVNLSGPTAPSQLTHVLESKPTTSTIKHFKCSVSDKFKYDVKQRSVALVVGESGAGPSIIVRDLSKTNLQMIWTDGLIGCMGLAIVGYDKATQREDLFFSHARQWDDQSELSQTNPIVLARAFIKSHDHIRIFWGTQTHSQNHVSYTTEEQQRMLSNQLGVWAEMENNVAASCLGFSIRHRAMMHIANKTQPTHEKNFYIARTRRWNIATHNKIKNTYKSPFAPDFQREFQLKTIYHSIGKYVQKLFCWDRTKKRMKLSLIQKLMNAYHIGNMDVLRALNQEVTFSKRTDLSRASKTAKLLHGDVALQELIQACHQHASKI